MTQQVPVDGKDRREDIRLASYETVDAAVMDRHDQPVGVLRDAVVVNVSAGGLMLVSDASAEAGTRLEMRLDGARGTRIGLEAISSSPVGEKGHRICCKLVDGNMPARLIYNW